MEFKNLLLNFENRIATVTINRPKVMNALNPEVLTELMQAFTEIIRNRSEVGGVIITGSGDKAFVAGADIAAMQTMTALHAEQFCRLGHRCTKIIEEFDMPVIAAVNGFALGGGLELALSCDFIYASKTAKLGLPEVNLGLFPGFGGTQRLARLIGRNKAKELIYTAAMLNAEQAFAIGIVNRVSEPENLLEDAKKTMNIMLSKGPVAIRLTKKVINEGTDLPRLSGLNLEETQFPLVFATEDRMEGVTAFLEKRPAKFTGK
ncbi:MAG: enoyl-CoA hydratase-related protein [bacterium]|nr:enoyl-CoA hydratase/isomerase family protein [bacterium]MBU1917509.1 enoyl-CoA hydratase/isomerase family protein [bacterium]